MQKGIFHSENYYPTVLDLAKALTLAKRKHCVVEIDCKYCIVQVDESMTLESGRQQVESIIYS